MKTTLGNLFHFSSSNEKLKKRIQELDTALLYTDSQHPFQSPVYLINNVQVDDENNLLFALRNPLEQENKFDESLPVTLNFFRKGIAYWLKIAGRARIWRDINAETFIEKAESVDDYLVIKIAVESVEEIDIEAE